MKEVSALTRLKDGELCIVTMKDGDREARWSVANWCFFYLDRGTPVVCRADEIEEWRPASMSC
ncbi:MAG TPA: hypothetical protein VGE12_03595 [Noviherbaspirillum sp.]